MNALDFMRKFQLLRHIMIPASNFNMKPVLLGS